MDHTRYTKGNIEPSLEDFSYYQITAERLIRALDKAYPAQCVGRFATTVEHLVEAQRYAGKRELIDELLAGLENPET